MKTIFFSATKGSMKDESFYDMVYKIAFTLSNLKCLQMATYLDYYKRTVYLIMTELNLYGFKRCSALTDRKSYMLLDNVNLEFMAKDSKTIRTDIIDLLAIPTSHDEKVQYEYHFDLELIYTKFVSISKVVIKFKENIKFFWEGGVRSLEEIFIQVMSPITLQPHLLYEVYENILKFFCVAFYLEIKNSFNCIKSMNKNRVKDFNKIFLKFSIEKFPTSMRSVVTDLKNEARIPDIDDKTSLRHCKHWNPKKFLMGMNEWSITVIEPEKKCTGLSVSCFSGDNKAYDNSIFNLNDINIQLDIVSKYILLII